MSYPNYLKIKDKACLIYSGHNIEYLIQLRMLKPALKLRFPEIDFTFTCRNEYSDYLENTIPFEIYNEAKHDYAFRYEIIYDALSKKHPIVEMIESSNISFEKTETLTPRGHIAYISTIGDFPNVDLTPDQITKASNFVRNKGFKSQIINKKMPAHEVKRLVMGAAYVIGTPNELFYEAVAVKTPTVLISSNLKLQEAYKMFVKSPNVLP